MEREKNYFDVVIAGAGIAGLLTAWYLSKKKLKIAVLEQKKEAGYPVCCGEAVSKKAFDNLGFSYDSFIDTSIKGFRVFLPDKNFFYVDTEGYLINRDKFEKNIAENLAMDGVRLFFGTKVLNIKKEKNAYIIFTSRGNFYSDFMIGADGPDSITDKTFFKNSYETIDAVQFKIKKENFHYDTGNFLDFYYDNLSKFYFWVFAKQKEINLGGIVKGRDTLIKFITKNFPMTEPGHAFFSRGKIPKSWIKKQIYRDNCFLVGDAAGLTNPVSLAGIYSSIFSAKTCSECIFSFLESHDKKHLFNYEKIIRKELYSPAVDFVVKYCYSMPEKTLNFVGNYFKGSSYRKKDFLKFFRMSFKNPWIYKYLPALIIQRQLLRYGKDKLW
ncbi:MAG TPA: NAD(P)/FAD-dependent oxidoreductase [Candidatus Goldiibacteriota bacterium]|nr:NAD(P)/FAD-dependent oxidoreductase [Candidatus Goldiibacteriota bacterium]